MPPDMPAAKLRPVLPSTTTMPPVMYSQQWSPAPSTTAIAPELRTAKRSPPMPRRYHSHTIAPYSPVLPTIMDSSGTIAELGVGLTLMLPPDKLSPAQSLPSAPTAHA